MKLGRVQDLIVRRFIFLAVFTAFQGSVDHGDVCPHIYICVYVYIYICYRGLYIGSYGIYGFIKGYIGLYIGSYRDFEDYVGSHKDM